MKKFNPYLALKEEFRTYVLACKHRTRIETCYFSKKAVEDRQAYVLDDIAQRIVAARQLGYVTEIRWDNERGLVLEFVKILPPGPWWV